VPLDEPGVAPLTADEEAVWRTLARLVVVLPRLLDADLLRQQGLTLSEYHVLMALSESTGSAQRMSELADQVMLSVSGLTRLVERLTRQGLVERVTAETDRRGQVAVLTPAGRERLVQAWPAHLESVRRTVFDNLEGVDLGLLGRALTAIAEQGGDTTVRRRL
jgi:DNA-binding MarR family transcriptional regulator